MSYLRCRIANAASEVANPTGTAATGEVEDYPVTIISVDYGDAPDTAAGTAQGNYNTTGDRQRPEPRHRRQPAAGRDDCAGRGPGTLQNAAANADDTSNTGAADDEDGVTTLPSITPASTSVALNVSTLQQHGAAGDRGLLHRLQPRRRLHSTPANGPRPRSASRPAASHQDADLHRLCGAPTPGASYLRCRLANTAAEVTNADGRGDQRRGGRLPQSHRQPGLRRCAGHGGRARAQGDYNTHAGGQRPAAHHRRQPATGRRAAEADDGTQQNVDADDDDGVGVDDEEGVTTLPTVTSAATSVPLSVSALNNTGAAGDAGLLASTSTGTATSSTTASARVRPWRARPGRRR